MTMLTSTLTLLLLSQVATPQPVDVSAFRDKLVLLTDGKGHYVAVMPTRPLDGMTFSSGDGKTFVRVPVFGGGSSGEESWSINIWDPRVRYPDTGPAQLAMTETGKKFEAVCGKKSTELSRVPEAEAKKLLEAAKFMTETWTRRPEKLLRDDTGIYFLVDRFRSKDDSDRRDFRVFMGPKGNMKLLPLKNIVDDTQGMILATKTGNLRLVTSAEGKLEGKWVQGKTETKLVEIDLDRYDTGRLVYLDLGPYSNQRLGTPCDDFM